MKNNKKTFLGTKDWSNYVSVDTRDQVIHRVLRGENWGRLNGTVVFWREMKTEVEVDKEFEWIQIYPAFEEWCSNYDFAERDGYTLKWIEIQQIDSFGIDRSKNKSKGFLKFEPCLTKPGLPRPIPSIIFMRGDSICILIVLIDKQNGKKFSVLTNQARAATGKSQFLEIPAGMVDSGTVTSAAISEIQQETGIIVDTSFDVSGEGQGLINLPKKLGVVDKLYMSPGGCDEKISFFLYEATATDAQIQSLNGNIEGEKGEGEEIKVVITELKNVTVMCPDAKSVICMYYYDKFCERFPDRNYNKLQITRR